MEYIKPTVIIDLDEYLHLKNIEAESKRLEDMKPPQGILVHHPDSASSSPPQIFTLQNKRIPENQHNINKALELVFQNQQGKILTIVLLPSKTK